MPSNAIVLQPGETLVIVAASPARPGHDLPLFPTNLPVVPPGGAWPGGGGGGGGGGPVDPGYSPPWAQLPVDPGYGYPIGGPGRPTHPIYNPAYPDNSLPQPPEGPPPIQPPPSSSEGNWVWAWSPQQGRWVWVQVPGEGQAGPK